MKRSYSDTQATKAKAPSSSKEGDANATNTKAGVDAGSSGLQLGLELVRKQLALKRATEVKAASKAPAASMTRYSSSISGSKNNNNSNINDNRSNSNSNGSDSARNSSSSSSSSSSSNSNSIRSSISNSNSKIRSNNKPQAAVTTSASSLAFAVGPVLGKCTGCKAIVKGSWPEHNKVCKGAAAPGTCSKCGISVFGSFKDHNLICSSSVSQASSIESDVTDISNSIKSEKKSVTTSVQNSTFQPTASSNIRKNARSSDTSSVVSSSNISDTVPVESAPKKKKPRTNALTSTGLPRGSASSSTTSDPSRSDTKTTHDATSRDKLPANLNVSNSMDSENIAPSDTSKAVPAFSQSKTSVKAAISADASAQSVATDEADPQKKTSIKAPPPPSSSSTSSEVPISDSGAIASKSGSWNFTVDYNDHFETPSVAYQDLVPLIDSWCKLVGKSRESITIYDPYYCKGKMVSLLKKMGFKNIINENRDFYKDIKENSVPDHDILLTNPPYSGEHKQQLLRYLRGSKKPFALLLPAYTANKSYWREFEEEQKQQQQQQQQGGGLCYVMPSESYEYNHPEGTGKDIPPFYSSWFCYGLSGPSAAPALSTSVEFVYSVDEMIAKKFIKGDKRPNPKQRLKMKANLQSK